MVRLVDDDVGEVIWSEPIVSAEKGLNGSDDDTELWTREVLSAFECSVSTDGLLDLVLGLLKEFFAVRDDEGATLGAIGYVSGKCGFCEYWGGFPRNWVCWGYLFCGCCPK